MFCRFNRNDVNTCVSLLLQVERDVKYLITIFHHYYNIRDSNLEICLDDLEMTLRYVLYRCRRFTTKTERGKIFALRSIDLNMLINDIFELIIISEKYISEENRSQENSASPVGAPLSAREDQSSFWTTFFIIASHLCFLGKEIRSSCMENS